MYFPNLFQEEKIGTCLLRNRLIMSLYPTKYSADSRVNERMIEFYSERARGGVAMIVLDYVLISRGRIKAPMNYVLIPLILLKASRPF